MWLLRMSSYHLQHLAVDILLGPYPEMPWLQRKLKAGLTKLRD